MKTDLEVQTDVVDQLAYEPRVNSEHIGVSVENGVVTLSGTVSSYVEKRTAERSAQRVTGIRGIVEQIRVKMPDDRKRTDADIAIAISTQLQWHVQLPENKIKIAVENGRVTLSGELEWQYQRNEAEKVVRKTAGVIEINNHLTLKPTAQIRNIKDKIQDALRREADREASHISVDVNDGKVILSGHVDSYEAMDEAKWAAWSALGVHSVENKLTLV
jgi:osmotically-inducible protein OsmY